MAVCRDLVHVVKTWLRSAVLIVVFACCTARQEDDEAVLCIVCAFCQLIIHEDVRSAVAKDTRILTDLS